jgi:glycine cleavage system aminomethyltransferase T
LVTIIFDQTDVYPIGNEPVLDMSGQIIGKTTSASFGYRAGVPVALALIQKDQAVTGNHVQIDIAGQLANARVSLRPAFDPDGKMMRPLP